MKTSGSFKKGHKVPQEWRDAVSKALKGKISNKKGKTFEKQFGKEKAEKIKKKMSKNTKKLFDEGLIHGMKGKHHTKESREKMSKAVLKNHANYWKGKPRSEETKEKIRLAHLGKKQTKESIEKRVRKIKGKKRSEKTRIKISLAHTKEKEFTGFKRTFNKRLRGNLKYIEWRKAVYERDNYTCQDCFRKNLYLMAHHIIFLNDILKQNNIISLEQAENCKELWDLDNGITLCVKCHQKKHQNMKICPI